MINFERDSKFFVDSWHNEQDNITVTLYRNNFNDDILTLSDGEYHQAVEDGFINPNRLLDSMVWYAEHQGLI